MSSEQYEISVAGFSVAVLIDGAKTPHYSVECHEEEKQSTCWIASEAEKSFTIEWERTAAEASYQIRTSYFIDGTLVNKDVHSKWSLNEECTGVRVSQNEERELIFAPLELTDDDSYLQASNSQNIGEIKVVFEKVECKNSTSKGKSATYALPEPGKVHEKEKKGLTHQVKLGEIQLNKASYVHCTILSKVTIATFIFKYRPLGEGYYVQVYELDTYLPYLVPAILAVLQANGLTTIDTKGQHHNEEGQQPVKPEDVGESSEEDEILDVTLEERQRKLEKELKEIKRKRAGTSNARRSHAPKRIKREHKSNFVPGEIIDLTIE